MSGIGDRIRAKRLELGLSQTELGKRAGGISYQAVQQVEAGGGSKHIVAIARALSVSPDWLETGKASESIKSENNDGTFITAGVRLNASEGHIKVLGMAECGPDGWSLWNGEVVDYVPRPPNLSGAVQAYAVFAVGDSMEPRYHAGELVYIHPGKPVTPGSYVLVQLVPKESGGTPRAVLKRLIRRSGNKIILSQYNPAKPFEIKADEVVSMHRVVGSGEA